VCVRRIGEGAHLHGGVAHLHRRAVQPAGVAVDGAPRAAVVAAGAREEGDQAGEHRTGADLTPRP
jgi:hypothetical protein